MDFFNIFYKKKIKSDFIQYRFLCFKFKIKRYNDDFDKLRKKVFYNQLYQKLKDNNYKLPSFDEKGISILSINWENVAYLFKNLNIIHVDNLDNKIQIPKFNLLWGFSSIECAEKTLDIALEYNIPIYIVEDGFLKSADTWVKKNIPMKYKHGVSFTIDPSAPYFDATRTTLLEKLLNDKDLIIDEKQIERAKTLIHTIIKNKLTKYNHQPIFTPNIGTKNRKKVLVVDQSFGDFSIVKGLANEHSFNDMLNCAIQENPDADIIIKTHPDHVDKRRSGYFSKLTSHDNIYIQTDEINPISLLEYVDKVYVVTTQLGFEALMCNKEVHVFGMPFYANWGLTIDRLHCARRTNTRTLEEMFYITYIMYTHWVNPETKSKCEIEEAIDYLLKIREEYLQYQNNN